MSAPLSFWARHTAPAKRLLATVVLMDASVACLLLAVQFRGISLHAPEFILGLLGTLVWAALAVGCMFLGGLSDRYGRRRLMAVAVSLLAAVCLTLSQVRNLWLLLALMPVAGLALALYWPAAEAWLAELVAGNRRRSHRYLSAFNICWAGGAMLGPLAAGRLWKIAHPLPFVLSAVVLMVLLGVALSIPKPVTADIEEDTEPVSHLSPETIWTFVLIAWVANFAAGFCAGVVTVLFPKLGDSLGYTSTQVGNLIFLLYASQMCLFAVARLTRAWRYRLGILLGSQLVGIIGLVLIARVGSVRLFALALVCYGICNAMSYLSSMTYTLESTSTARAQRSGWHEAIGGSGVIVGPLVGGLLAQEVSLRSPFIGAAVLLALAMVAQLVLWSRRPRPVAEAAA